MWNSAIYDINTPVDYKYYHLFHGNNIYNKVQYFEFKNDTMYVRTRNVLKQHKKSMDIVPDNDEFDKLSKLIEKEYTYYKMMYGFKFCK